jgi:hypothetical protein
VSVVVMGGMGGMGGMGCGGRSYASNGYEEYRSTMLDEFVIVVVVPVLVPVVSCVCVSCLCVSCVSCVCVSCVCVSCVRVSVSEAELGFSCTPIASFFSLPSLPERCHVRCHRIIGVVSVYNQYNCVYYCDTCFLLLPTLLPLYMVIPFSSLFRVSFSRPRKSSRCVCVCVCEEEEEEEEWGHVSQ